MPKGLPGKFVMLDGLDGVGKGVALGALVDYEKQQGKDVYDLNDYWETHKDHPEYEQLKKHDVIVSHEPTYACLGLMIRNEIIAENNRQYTARDTALAYSLDRLCLYKRLLITCFENAKTVLQSRGVISSLAYQQLQAKEEGSELSLEDIMNFSGNKLALEYAPDLLIIPTIKNVDEVMKRLENRGKDDNAIFEKLDFQLKLKPIYEGKELREIFESRGSRVEYLDAGVSIEHSRNEAVRIYKDYMQ